MPLETYQSHKIVDAGKIAAFDLGQKAYQCRLEGADNDRVVTLKIGDRILQMAAEVGLPVVGGYLVYYPDGYISWSPPGVFEDNYLLLPPKTTVESWDATAEGTFGSALAGVRRGERWARPGWNGKEMWIYLVPGSRFGSDKARPPLNTYFDEGTQIEYRPHIDMRTADGSLVPWVASQTDLLADDWMRVG